MPHRKILAQKTYSICLLRIKPASSLSGLLKDFICITPSFSAQGNPRLNTTHYFNNFLSLCPAVQRTSKTWWHLSGVWKTSISAGACGLQSIYGSNLAKSCHSQSLQWSCYKQHGQTAKAAIISNFLYYHASGSTCLPFALTSKFQWLFQWSFEASLHKTEVRICTAEWTN